MAVMQADEFVTADLPVTRGSGSVVNSGGTATKMKLVFMRSVIAASEDTIDLGTYQDNLKNIEGCTYWTVGDIAMNLNAGTVEAATAANATAIMWTQGDTVSKNLKMFGDTGTARCMFFVEGT